jgi:protein TonB
MFASVLDRNLPPRQFAGGAALAFGVHAAVLTAAILLAARPQPAVQGDLPPMTVFHPSRFVELGSTTREAPATKRASDRRTMRALSRDHERTKRTTTEAPASAAPTSHFEGDSAPSPSTATEAGGSASEGAGANAGAGTGNARANTMEALPFGEGMQRPTLLDHPAPVYSREASAARASGSVIAKCVITVEGALRNCRIVRGVPHMDAAVLEALSHWRYTPVTFQGRPVSVAYTIQLRLVSP